MQEVQQNPLDQKVKASIAVEEKVCRKCSKTLSTSAFRKSIWHGHKDGLIPYCRECERVRARDHVKIRKPVVTPLASELRINPTFTPFQMTKDEARALFDYEPRNGDLLWKKPPAGSKGRRVLTRLHSLVANYGAEMPSVTIDGALYRVHVLVWNWHKGKTDLAIDWKDGNRLNNKIGNLAEVATIRLHDKPSPRLAGFVPKMDPALPLYAALTEPTTCPCCRQAVWRPTFDQIVDFCGLQPLEEKILAAVWSGNGRPVLNARIFSFMYGGDEDGGPTENKMYAALKVALSKMRDKLEGSGVSIVNEGYAQGYRLIMGKD